MILRSTLLPLVLSLSVVLPGCDRKSGPPSGTHKIRIGLLPKSKHLDYFNSCADGARDAAAKLPDLDLVYDGPSSADPTAAADLMNQWIAKRFDVIAVAPNDPNVLAPVMQKARGQGIHVLTWDTDAPPEVREFFVNQATARQIGYALVDTMARDLHEEGDVAIIEASATSHNMQEWVKYMTERLSKFSKMKLVAPPQPSGEDHDKARQIAADLMKAYPTLRGIWGISSESFPGAADAVRDAGKMGQVLVCGLSTPNVMKEYVHDGTVKSVILWDTHALGALTIYACEAVVKGTLKPGMTSFTCPLGTKKIEGSDILLGNILVFTKDNIDQYNF